MGISNSWEWFALFDHPLIKVWPEKAGYAESESVCLYLNQKEPNRRKQYVLGDSGEVLLLQSDLSIASIATDFRVHKQEPSTHRRLQLDTRKSFFSKATKVLEKNSIKIPSKIGRGGWSSRWSEDKVNFWNILFSLFPLIQEYVSGEFHSGYSFSQVPLAKKDRHCPDINSKEQVRDQEKCPSKLARAWGALRGWGRFGAPEVTP